MCSLTRTGDDPYTVEYGLVDVLEVANKVKAVPREWICDDGMGVTDDFVRYVAPLAGTLPAQLNSLQ